MAASDISLAPPLVVLSRAYRVDWGLWLPGGILVLLLLTFFAGPAIFNIPGPNTGSLLDGLKPPFTAGHLLGTNNLGNDLLSQCLFGGRIALQVAFAAVVIGYLVGGSIGALSGYRGGVVDTVVMRVLDVVLSLPLLVIAMAIVTFVGASERNLILLLGFGTLPSKARVARAVTLKLRQRDFILASRLLGKRPLTVIVKHLVPNIAPTLMTFAFLNLSTIMIVMATLSFLGIGPSASTPSWGYEISQGQNYLVADPWFALCPCFFLFVTVLSLNTLSDNLRTRFRV
jgi:peptide/nickel transport system permease protein